MRRDRGENDRKRSEVERQFVVAGFTVKAVFPEVVVHEGIGRGWLMMPQKWPPID